MCVTGRPACLTAETRAIAKAAGTSRAVSATVSCAPHNRPAENAVMDRSAMAIATTATPRTLRAVCAPTPIMDNPARTVAMGKAATASATRAVSTNADSLSLRATSRTVTDARTATPDSAPAPTTLVRLLVLARVRVLLRLRLQAQVRLRLLARVQVLSIPAALRAPTWTVTSATDALE